MSVDNKAPEIRFKVFCGEWEEIVLANACLHFRSGKFIKAEDIKKVGAYPVYGGNGLRGYTSEYNHEGTYALIGRQGALCGNMNFSNGKAFFTEHAIAVQATEKNDTLFLYYKLGLMNLGQYSGQSAQPGLSVNKLTELEIFSPVKAEQTTIGNYFQKLDSLINQHHQKHDKLNSIKKAMLEKMFPKQGETIPEIRFKGFSGEWKYLTIGDCSSLITKGTTPMTIGKNFVDRGVTFVKVECVDEIGNLNPAKFAYIDNETDQALARSRIKENDLLVSIAGALGRAAIVKKEILPANTNQALAIVRLKNDSPIGINFLYHFTKSRDFKEFVDETASQGAQPNLSLGDISKLRILAPKKEEQTAIGNYFHKLDAMINQHQQQITKLNNIKQACLSKMFV